jgi:hypothetical protein
MRRLLANLVLLVTLWGYVAPAALGATEAELPACCRGNGKHHCSMAGMAQVGGDDSRRVSVNSPACPFRMLGSVLNGSRVGEAPKVFSLDLPALDWFLQSDIILRASALGIRNSGRGPPPFSLS